MSTNIRSQYIAPSCTNLTQTVIRVDSLQVELDDMDLTTYYNYSRVFTATFYINGPNPETISLQSDVPEIVLDRVGNDYIISSTYSKNGTVVNNYAYFKYLLRNLVLVTDTTVWPNPAFTIDVSTDICGVELAS